MAWKLLALLVGLTAAEVTAFQCDPGNMNALADSFILKQRKLMVLQGFTSLELQKQGSFHLIDGMKVSAVAFGLDSLRRTGNATLCIDKYENREVIEAEGGFDFPLLLATSLQLPSGEAVSAAFRTKGLSFRLAFRDNPDHSQCGFDHFEFTPAYEVRMYASDKTFDGEAVTEFFNTQVIPYANSQLLGLKAKLTDELGCHSLKDGLTFKTDDAFKRLYTLLF